jgi:3-oxoacyl-[acyl-carrier-protein] synthase-1
MSGRVFVTGYGIITSIGTNTAENLASLTQRKSGFGSLSVLETAHADSLPSCEVKYTDEDLCRLAGVQGGSGFTRTALLGLIALREAVSSAGLRTTQLADVGLISATTTGGIREFESCFYEIADHHNLDKQYPFNDTANPGGHAERLADTLGIRKQVSTLSTACSSSANSILLGVQLIRNKMAATVICGGTEALSKFTINGFNTLMIVDHEHCRPFDATRKGLNIGEGAGYLVLESEDAVVTSKKPVMAEVKGCGNANDAFHQTASSPEGTGAYLSMQQALTRADVAPDQIDYINAHGTATENNDLSEGNAMQRLFASRIPPFSSTKPNVGHTLAAAGSVEAIFCLMALEHQLIWPSLNFKNPMPELGIMPTTMLLDRQVKHVMSNSFGFGGNTTSLLFSRV